ncbi:Uncharacterised protein [Chlamydia trachomatis]|nr:Uncharacterised protein [Chlamydia trachomatis]
MALIGSPNAQRFTKNTQRSSYKQIVRTSVLLLLKNCRKCGRLPVLWGTEEDTIAGIVTYLQRKFDKEKSKDSLIPFV